MTALFRPFVFTLTLCFSQALLASEHSTGRGATPDQVLEHQVSSRWQANLISEPTLIMDRIPSEVWRSHVLPLMGLNPEPWFAMSLVNKGFYGFLGDLILNLHTKYRGFDKYIPWLIRELPKDELTQCPYMERMERNSGLDVGGALPDSNLNSWIIFGNDALLRPKYSGDPPLSITEKSTLIDRMRGDETKGRLNLGRIHPNFLFLIIRKLGGRVYFQPLGSGTLELMVLKRTANGKKEMSKKTVFEKSNAQLFLPHKLSGPATKICFATTAATDLTRLGSLDIDETGAYLERELVVLDSKNEKFLQSNPFPKLFQFGTRAFFLFLPLYTHSPQVVEILTLDLDHPEILARSATISGTLKTMVQKTEREFLLVLTTTKEKSSDPKSVKIVSIIFDDKEDMHLDELGSVTLESGRDHNLTLKCLIVCGMSERYLIFLECFSVCYDLYDGDGDPEKPTRVYFFNTDTKEVTLEWDLDFTVQHAFINSSGNLCLFERNEIPRYPKEGEKEEENAHVYQLPTHCKKTNAGNSHQENP